MPVPSNAFISLVWSPPGNQTNVACRTRAIASAGFFTSATTAVPTPASVHVLTALSPVSGSSDACGKITTRPAFPPAVSTARFTMLGGGAVAADDEQMALRIGCGGVGGVWRGEAERDGDDESREIERSMLEAPVR